MATVKKNCTITVSIPCSNFGSVPNKQKDPSMRTTQWKLWRCVVTVIATTILTTTAVADDAKKDEVKPPQRQMLYNIFAPIMHDMGSCNLQKAIVVSGPIDMKMTNNKQPGKQWWVRLGQSNFKVTIEDSTDMQLETALSYAERIPVAYRRALEIVSEDNKAGLA